MGRRVRHINAKHAGAVMHLDSRFINGISDNTAISSWIDRTGTFNPTMPSLLNQPIFSASIVAGCPAVKFNRPSSYLTGSDVSMSINQLTYIGVHYPTMSFSLSIPASNRFGVPFEYGTNALNQNVVIFYGDGNIQGDNAFGITQFGDNVSVSNQGQKWIIGACRRGTVGTGSSVYNVNVYPDKLSNVKSMTTSTVKNGIFFVGGSNNVNIRFPGYIASEIYFPYYLSDSLQKRFIISMGYSFKISA